MIQEITPHLFDNTYRCDRAAKPGDYLTAFTPQGIVCSSSGEFLQIADSKEFPTNDLIYLFKIDKCAFYLTSEQNISQRYTNTKVIPLRALRTWQPQWLGFAMITCSHLAHWYRTQRFCGSCASPMQHSLTERALICTKCGLSVYPRINPAIIVAICDGNRLLLTHYANRTATPHWVLVAGYIEIGETPEDTIHREVMEETGLKVKNLRYFRSQPWAFSQSLLLGYFADLDGSDETILQKSELAEARWFERADIPPIANLASLTNTLIQAFIDGKYPH